MKLKLSIRELIEVNATNYNDRLEVRAQIDLDDLFDSIPEEEEIDVDIHELLAENRQIAHIWGIDDVQQQRPDLDDDQAWAVLQAVEKRLDWDYGITWDIIADELFRSGQTPGWQGHINVSVENYTRDAAIEHFENMAAHIETYSVNSTIKATFDPASLRLAEPDETTSK